MQRQHVDQRPEPDAFGALNGGAQEHARGGRLPKRRRMMFGQVKAVKFGLLDCLDQFQAPLEKWAELRPIIVEMVEYSEIEHA